MLLHDKTNLDDKAICEIILSLLLQQYLDPKGSILRLFTGVVMAKLYI